jgi:acyl-coenzyme A synthetase/AMP-(fatty) acid ligase
MVGFLAVVLRGQTNLLPASRANRAIEEIAAAYPGAYCLVDKPGAGPDNVEQIEVDLPPATVLGTERQFNIPEDQIAAILFTSGSTGHSRPSPKSWGELCRGVELTRQRLGFRRYGSQTIVATVPPYPMFGLETSLLLPLIANMGLYRGCPFYPGDVLAALRSIATARVLVTTPVHLRACVESGLPWPSCDLLLSATAPLPETLAVRAERLFGAPVMEIFGSTETGAVASRRTVAGPLWQPYEGVSILPHERGALVQAGHLRESVVLGDRIEPCGDGRFRLLGRGSDLVKIAGKRSSLGDLTLKLKQIKGVLDGVFLVPPLREGSAERVAALVVAPSLSKRQLLEELAQRIDPVFLPRPVVFTDRLPRNETGKLPRDDLLRMLAQSAKDR